MSFQKYYLYFYSINPLFHLFYKPHVEVENLRQLKLVYAMRV